MFVDETLDPADRERAIAHEVAYGIYAELAPPKTLKDYNVGNWGFKYNDEVIQKELNGIYRDSNNPTAIQHSPIDDGYTKQQARHELWTEAIRSYLTNPNYIKTVAPNAAEFLRARLREHPRLRQLIQFNALGPLAWWGSNQATSNGDADDGR